MLLVDLVWASLGGFVGAMIRYEVEVAISEKTKATFPVGAFVVNIIGCFIAGGLIPLGSDKLMKFFGPFLSVGLCGALTTFGTYVLDVLKLFEEGKKNAGIGVSVIVATVAACFACTTAGYFIVDAIVARVNREKSSEKSGTEGPPPDEKEEGQDTSSEKELEDI